MILNSTQVKQLLYNAGFRGTDLNNAVLIAECESGFNPNARNLTAYEDSRGLMQINLIAHPYYSMLDMYNPQINCDVAYQIYRENGNSFGAWTCSNQINKENPQNYLGITLALLIGAYYISVAQ